MARAIAWVLVLSLFWAGLSGYLKPLLVVSGVLSIAFSWWFVRRAEVELEDWSVGRILMACVTYLPWLLWQVLLSNLRVIKIVWSPQLPIAPRVVEVPCTLATPTGKALFANSITMTPGTVTLSVGESLLVHALTAEDAAGVLDGSMHARVQKLEPGSPTATPAPAPAATPAAAEPKPEAPAAEPEASAAEPEAPAAEPEPKPEPEATAEPEASTEPEAAAAEPEPKPEAEGGAS